VPCRFLYVVEMSFFLSYNAHALSEFESSSSAVCWEPPFQESLASRHCGKLIFFAISLDGRLCLRSAVVVCRVSLKLNFNLTLVLKVTLSDFLFNPDDNFRSMEKIIVASQDSST